jgi:hypothetical protein
MNQRMRCYRTVSLRLPPCMGGWCTARGSCARYHEAPSVIRPSERLCKAGGMNAYKPIAVREAE